MSVDMAVIETGKSGKAGESFLVIKKKRTLAYLDRIERSPNVRSVTRVTSNEDPKAQIDAPVLSPTEDKLLFQIIEKRETKRSNRCEVLWIKDCNTEWAAFHHKRTSNSSSIDQLLHIGASGVTAWPRHDLFSTFPSLPASGLGCKGTRGVPFLRSQAGSCARIGRSFTIELARPGVCATEPEGPDRFES